MSAHETTSSGDLVAPEGRRQDVLAILTLTATVLLTLALISYDARNGSARRSKSALRLASDSVS